MPRVQVKHVTEDSLRKYIKLFQSCLSDTADKYFSFQIGMDLLPLALLSAHIIGYVFTQFGTANFPGYPYHELAQKVVAVGVIT